jgi:hypothetical protein
MEDKMNNSILTGVLGANSPFFNSESFWDEGFIDAQFEAHREELISKFESEGYHRGSAEEHADNLMEEEFWETGTDLLYGSWVMNSDREYEPDESGQFAAIYDSNSNVFQIVWSKYYVKGVRMCSPCYPNQGDLGSPDGDYDAYCLPFWYHDGLLLKQIRHINFEKAGLVEDFWYDHPTAFDRIYIAFLNECMRVGLDPTVWVPYSCGVDPTHTTVWDWGAMIEFVGYDDVRLTFTCDFNSADHGSWRNSRIFLDTRDTI